MRSLALLSGCAVLLLAVCPAPPAEQSRLAAAVAVRYVDLTHELSSESDALTHGDWTRIEQLARDCQGLRK